LFLIFIAVRRPLVSWRDAPSFPVFCNFLAEKPLRSHKKEDGSFLLDVRDSKGKQPGLNGGLKAGGREATGTRSSRRCRPYLFLESNDW